mgnify:CR=1 FL=1
MVAQICDYLHNYFLLNQIYGEFSISSGLLTIEGILEGQRFRIRGSALNDGIYTYHAEGITDDDDSGYASLVDETFTGYVDLMGVPRQVLSIAGEISAWLTANADAINSPYTSESFGGYSYTKKSGVDAYGNDALDWRNVFGKSLIAWRKIG